MTCSSLRPSSLQPSSVRFFPLQPSSPGTSRCRCSWAQSSSSRRFWPRPSLLPPSLLRSLSSRPSSLLPSSPGTSWQRPCGQAPCWSWSSWSRQSSLPPSLHSFSSRPSCWWSTSCWPPFSPRSCLRWCRPSSSTPSSRSSSRSSCWPCGLGSLPCAPPSDGSTGAGSQASAPPTATVGPVSLSRPTCNRGEGSPHPRSAERGVDQSLQEHAADARFHQQHEKHAVDGTRQVGVVVGVVPALPVHPDRVADEEHAVQDCRHGQEEHEDQR